jgi:hypothetical protein
MVVVVVVMVVVTISTNDIRIIICEVTRTCHLSSAMESTERGDGARGQRDRERERQEDECWCVCVRVCGMTVLLCEKWL